MGKFPHKLLIFGVFFILFGSGLLLMNTGIFPRLLDLWPATLAAFGLLLLYLVYARGAKKAYMLPGYFFTMTGLILLVLFALWPLIEFRKVWPLFMLLIGLSMFPYLANLSGNKRIVIAVPAVTIIILSLVFLLFSLDIIKMSFSRFVAMWWPILFVFLGIILFVEAVKKRE